MMTIIRVKCVRTMSGKRNADKVEAFGENLYKK